MNLAFSIHRRWLLKCDFIWMFCMDLHHPHTNWRLPTIPAPSSGSVFFSFNQLSTNNISKLILGFEKNQKWPKKWHMSSRSNIHTKKIRNCIYNMYRATQRRKCKQKNAVKLTKKRRRVTHFTKLFPFDDAFTSRTFCRKLSLLLQTHIYS